jgi:hypothetical protein
LAAQVVSWQAIACCERGNLDAVTRHGLHEGDPRPAIPSADATSKAADSQLHGSGATQPFGVRPPSVNDLFEASREALLDGMVAVGSANDELIGWTHFLREYKAGQRWERPTAIGTCYGLKSMLLLGAMDPRYRQHRVLETLWRLQAPGGGWSARTQSAIGRPEITALVLSALLQAGADDERIASAARRCVELLDPETDEVAWERTLVITTALSVLARMSPATSFTLRLRDLLLRGRIRDPEHELLCWGERLLTDALGEKVVAPSVPHTARAIIALRRIDHPDQAVDQAVDEAVRWLIARHDLSNQTEQIGRALPDFRWEVLVMRHFTAAWVARALMSVEDGRHEGSSVMLGEAVESIHQHQVGGLWEWDNKERPIWMTYQGIATLRLHALRTSRLPA